MTDRLEAEVELLHKDGWEVESGEGYQWIVVKGVLLPDGWNRSETDVLIRIRPGYPTTPPDNFYVEADLRLANGNKPGNAPKEETVGGRSWLMFSYHLEDGDWDPHAEPEKGHNLLTYLEGVRRRLSEAN